MSCLRTFLKGLFLSFLIVGLAACGKGKENPLEIVGTQPNWRDLDRIMPILKVGDRPNYIEFLGIRDYEVKVVPVGFVAGKKYQLENIKVDQDECSIRPIVEMNLIGVDEENKIVEKVLLLDGEDFIFNPQNSLFYGLQFIGYHDSACGTYGITFSFLEV